MDLNRWKPVLLAIPLLLAGGAAQAQNVVDVTVPFEFTVQHHVMPAGRYRIERDAQHPTALLIREQDGAHATLVVSTMTASGHDPAGEQASLVFTHRDNAYQLADVWQDRSDGEAIVPAR